MQKYEEETPPPPPPPPCMSPLTCISVSTLRLWMDQAHGVDSLWYQHASLG